MEAERFVAYYEGKRIANAGKLEEFPKMRSVRQSLGKKEFLIRRFDFGKAEVIS